MPTLPTVIRWPFTLFSILFIMAIASCTGYNPATVSPGTQAYQSEIFYLTNGAIKDGVLDTADLHLDFSLSTQSSQFTISGTIKLNPSITYTFPIARRFFLKLNFLDSSGYSIDSVDISPLVSPGNTMENILAIQKTGPMPTTTTAIAFNYFAEFMDSPRDPDGDSTSIHYSPFQR